MLKKAVLVGTLTLQVVSLGLSIWMLKNPEKYGEINGKILKGMTKVL